MNKLKATYIGKVLLAALMVVGCSLSTFAQESPKEEDYCRIMRVRALEDIRLEVGGSFTLANSNVEVSYRRAYVFIVENPTSTRQFIRKFALRLLEILGPGYEDGELYFAQRVELT